MIRRVLVAGGGTGGHLFPGLAVIEELRRRGTDIDVLFVGTDRGIEARLLPERGERFVALPAAPLVGVGATRLLRGLGRLPRAGGQALATLMSFRPDLVLGLGGYASGPMMAAAIAARVPTALLEQNVHVGLTNRVLARMVGRAYLTYPETAHLFGDKRARVFGNPMRRAFVEAARAARHDPAGIEARARDLLVLGGSQGAKALNETVPEALAQLGASLRGMRIVHQTGSTMLDEVRASYQALGIDANVTPFIDDMARAYGHAALVVARAGATTLAELCAIGRPAVLIPFPHAAEDHQTRNAEALERAGAAVVAHEHEIDAARLAAQIGALLTNDTRRREMAEAARSLGRPEAAAAIVDDLSDWLGAPIGGRGQPEPNGDAPISGPGTSEQQAATARRVQRRPRVQRAALRLHTIEPARDAVG